MHLLLLHLLYPKAWQNQDFPNYKSKTFQFSTLFDLSHKKIRRNPFNRVLLFGDTVPIKAVGKIGIVDSLSDIE